jgi:branched-chain amino acid transport system permease protein
LFRIAGRSAIKDFINAIVSGLISGSLYAAMVMGLTIVYGVIRLFNFSHGLLAVLGGYFAWMFLTWLNWPLPLAMAGSVALMFLLGWGLFRVAIRPLIRSASWELAAIIFTLGLGLFLENTTLMIFGPRFKVIPVFIDGNLVLGFVQISWHELLLIGIVLVFLLALNLFLKKTWFGQAMRAVAQDMDGAGIVGINLDRTFGLAFATATAVTAFSGILLGTKYYLTPSAGWPWMVTGFAIIVLGGLGSAGGAMLGAFILGISQALTTLYLGALWVVPVWFGLFLIILLLRPQGLAGGRTI